MIYMLIHHKFGHEIDHVSSGVQRRGEFEFAINLAHSSRSSMSLCSWGVSGRQRSSRWAENLPGTFIVHVPYGPSGRGLLKVLRYGDAVQISGTVVSTYQRGHIRMIILDSSLPRGWY